MSNEVQEQQNLDQSVEATEESSAPVRTTGFDVALVEGRYVRLLEGVEVPEGEIVYLFDDLESLELPILGQIYGALAGVAAKKFRSPKIAVESIAFQLKKQAPTNPWAPKVVSKPTEVAGERGEKKERAKKEHTTTNITLHTPDDLAEQLKKLAPQAREVVAIISELAAAKGSATFTDVELSAELNLPASIERLKTRQSPDRIYAYYRHALIGSGIITVA